MVCTTLNKIRAQKPCADGWEKLLKALGKKTTDDEPLALLAVLDSNGLDDCLWALRSVPEYDNLWRKYAVWCARRVEHLMMDDDRSKSTLDVAWAHSEGKATDEELCAAAAAAWASWVDADAGAAGAAAAWAAWVDAGAADAGAWAAWVDAGAADAGAAAAWAAWASAASAAGAAPAAGKDAATWAVAAAAAWTAGAAWASAAWAAAAWAAWAATSAATRAVTQAVTETAQKNKLREILVAGEWC